MQLTTLKDRWLHTGIDYEGGAELLPFHADSLHSSQNILSSFVPSLKQILADPNSQKIFYFLCLNLGKLL